MFTVNNHLTVLHSAANERTAFQFPTTTKLVFFLPTTPSLHYYILQYFDKPNKPSQQDILFPE